jgi:hypothetical protein
MKKVKGLMDEHKGSVYNPLSQLHLDCCEMDAPELHENTYFLIIVDWAGDFIEGSAQNIGQVH